MFGWIKGCLILLSVLLVVACVQEGQRDNSSSAQDASGVTEGDAAVRIAIHYVGDVNCRKHLETEHDEEHIAQVIQANNKAEYIKKGKNTHRLDGDKAELSSKEHVTKAAKPPRSGDKFLQANNIPRTLATIEDYCRRLLLSVDSEDMPRLRSDNIADDTEAKDRFTADFGDFGGEVTCGNGRNGNLGMCSFSQINEGSRYFAYLHPQQGEKNLAAEVTYTQEGKEVTKTITVASIYRDQLQLPTTKLSDIEVKADCGEDNGCLFAKYDTNAYTLNCRVDGSKCKNGFSFTAEKVKCNDSDNACPTTTEPKQGKLCTGTATVADLSEQEISLKCEFSMNKEVRGSREIQIKTHHLAGNLCVITRTTKNEHNHEGLSALDPLIIEESACEKDDKAYRLELSFALTE